MFDFIRTHQRLMQLVLLLLIFPSFVFFGLEGYSRIRDDGNAIATVAGQPITQQEWDDAHRRQLDRMREMFGGKLDPKAFDTPEAKQGILEGLIAQRALAAEVVHSRLTTSDQALQQSIMGMEGLTTPDGKFDNDTYKALLAAQNMTPAIFEERLRQDLAVQQLNAAVQTTAFAPKTVASRISDINDQQRDVQQQLFKNADYVAQVKVTDAMLKDFYAKNGALFAVPEQAKAEYVVLDSATIAAQVNVSDDEIKSYYESNKQRFTVDEQRRASHILIAVNKSASDADKAAAKAKAEKLLAELKKSPSSFAKLAKENSQDPGSAEKGGDLGFFGHKAMVKPFEDAVYKLKEGEISDLVQSDFGYHIIQLTGIKPGSIKPLEEVKPELTAEIKKQLASRKFSDSAELFRNTVEDQSDSLKPVADKLKLKIETIEHIGRQPNPTLAPNLPYNDPKFLEALFSDDTVKNKRNTLAIQIGPNTLIAGRVVEYKPAAQKPFEEVQATVRERVVQQEAAKLAKQAGEARLTALKTKDDAAGFGETKQISRIKNEGMDFVAFGAVMKADVSKLPAYASAETPQGFAVYRIAKVAQPATLDAARRKNEAQQIGNGIGAQETYAYLEMLKQKAKVKILKPFNVKTDSDDKPAMK